MGDLVTHRVGDETRRGYLAIPSTGATSPAVIVIPERWGLVPQITSVVDRFADAGFVAYAPDFTPGRAAEAPGPGYPVTGPELDAAAGRVAEVAEWLTTRPEVAGKLGCVGFCAGGTLALWSATRSERIVATAAFYPALSETGPEADWAGYAGRAAVLHRPTDSEICTPEGVRAVERAVEAAGGTCQIHEYPGAGHGFFNDDRPESFDRTAAASAWARTLELFRARLG